MGAAMNAAFAARWTLLEHVPDAVLVTNRHGSIEFANQRLCALFGYDRLELKNAPLQLLVPPQARVSHDLLVSQFALTPHTLAHESRPALEAMHRDGATFPVHIHVEPFAPDFAIASLRPALDTRSSTDSPARSEAEARALLDLAVQRLYGLSLVMKSTAPQESEIQSASETLIDETIAIIRTWTLEPGGRSDNLAAIQAKILEQWRLARNEAEQRSHEQPLALGAEGPDGE